MAFQILTGNVDNAEPEYVPLQSFKFRYMVLPGLGQRWKLYAAGICPERVYGSGKAGEIGVSNYWGNVLFQRCLKSEAFREELDAAIQDLRSSFTEERLQTMVDGYTAVVKPYLYSMPGPERTRR